MYQTLGGFLAPAGASLFHVLLPALEPTACCPPAATILLLMMGLLSLASVFTHLFLAIVGICGLVRWFRCMWQGRLDEEITKKAGYGSVRTGIARLRTQ